MWRVDLRSKRWSMLPRGFSPPTRSRGRSAGSRTTFATLLHFDDLTVYEIDEPAARAAPGVRGRRLGRRGARQPDPARDRRDRLGGRATAARATCRTSAPSRCRTSSPARSTSPRRSCACRCSRRERVLGALNVYRNGEDVAFTDEEVELVERFATMAALAYDSARQRHTLREQVRRDGLTGLLNHRACHERLREALADGDPVAVVLLDLDHFKVINDAHGHAEGDRVLAATAERLRSVVRAGDTVGRLGGEEFVLILPGADVRCRRGLRRARSCRAGRADRARPAAGRVRGRGRRSDRRRRRRGAARERRRRAVLGEAHRARQDRALRARRRPAGGRAAQRGRGAAGAGHRGDRDRLPAGRRARHGPCRRLRGARAVRARAAPRARRVVRAGAPGRARRGARGAGAARRAGGPGPPRGHLPGAERLAARAALRAGAGRAAGRSDRDRDRAHRARGVRRRGRARGGAGRAARAAARRSRWTTPAPATRACSRSSGSRPTSSSSTARWSTARTPTCRARRCWRR